MLPAKTDWRNRTGKSRCLERKCADRTVVNDEVRQSFVTFHWVAESYINVGFNYLAGLYHRNEFSLSLFSRCADAVVGTCRGPTGRRAALGDVRGCSRERDGAISARPRVIDSAAAYGSRAGPARVPGASGQPERKAGWLFSDHVNPRRTSSKLTKGRVRVRAPLCCTAHAGVYRVALHG